MKIIRDGKQVGVKTQLADMTIYFETEDEYQRRTKATQGIREWPTLEEDVKWACEKVYKDSHK